MVSKQSGAKGAVLEEILRAYFLRAGFFVIRGVPLKYADEVLTDVDLWLYERPTETSRRIQICDIKYKQRPKAVERILWTSGLARALDVDGAYVATTDKRKNLRAVAEKLDIQLIDGTDVQRIQNSPSVPYADRISDEQLIAELQNVDKSLHNKNLQDARIDILTSISNGFGVPSLIKSLEGFARLAITTITHQPNSKAARSVGRLAYIAAAIVCQSIDYVSVGAAFRTIEERRDLITRSIRFGVLANDDRKSLRLALALVEKYAPNGQGTANAIEVKLHQDLGRIPAEIVADQAVRILKGGQLFTVGRELEMAGYKTCLPTFDQLSLSVKSMLGALLDYSGVDRERFAKAWIVDNDTSCSDKEQEGEKDIYKQGCFKGL